MLVTKMVWIRPRGRVDLCSEMGIEMGIKREQQIKKKRVERERERERERVCVCVYVKRVVEINNKKIKKIDYLNKRGDRIDKLMWMFCKNECEK